MKLLINDYEDELKRLAEKATDIKVLIAFLTEGGLKWLPEKIPCPTEFIVGINLGITTPAALKEMQEQGINVMVFFDSKKMFHPKALYIKSEESETLIVGSNNLTEKGIAGNHELSVAVERDESSEQMFSDFLAYFESLKVHDCCGIPAEQFYDTYKPTSLKKKLIESLMYQKSVPLLKAASPEFKLDDVHVSSINAFIELVAEEYPKLINKKGEIIKNHPLKDLNDKEFLPIFTSIVSKASKGRMLGHSQFNIGGNWYRIPNILAVNQEKEPWDFTNSKGRLVLQIHFSDNFKNVFFSIVLQYNLYYSMSASEMPQEVTRRYQKILRIAEHASSRAEIDLPVFRHWKYKDEVLWSKPIMSFVYPVNSLPAGNQLCFDIEILAKIANGASAIS